MRGNDAPVYLWGRDSIHRHHSHVLQHDKPGSCLEKKRSLQIHLKMLLFWQTTALCLVTGIVSLVSANTEKTIFIAPKETEVSIQETALATSLAWLTPHSNVKRTYIPVIFPPPEDADRPAGTESWFYLSSMTPGQRHEVRICWAATVGSIAFELLLCMLGSKIANDCLATY